MAFGDLKGTLTGTAASITNPMPATGSVSVSVGDLVYVVISQQTNLTAGTTTDNLGNTYTPLHAGTDNGNTTGRDYYSRVTVAGTLTTINVAATASANDASVGALVIEGPFDASPLDANPAIQTSDVTSPLTCPSTGTLAQADEVVLCWGIPNHTNAWTATSPNNAGVDLVPFTNASQHIGYQTVTATTAVSPAWTVGVNPSTCMLAVASFKKENVVVPSIGGIYQPPSQPNPKGRVSKAAAVTLMAAGLFWTPQPVADDTKVDEWHRPLSEPVRAKPRQHQSLFWSPHVEAAAPQPGNDDVRVAEVDASIISRRYRLYPTYFDPVYVEQEIVTLDKWFEPLSEPVRRKPTVYSDVTWIPQPIAGDTTIDEWFRPLSEPTRRKVSVANQPSYTHDPTPFVPGPDSWQRPLSEPVLAKPKTHTQPDWYPQPIAGDTTVDEWHRPLSEPVRRKVSVANQPSLAWTPQPIADDTRLDEWYSPLSEPVRRAVRYQSEVYYAPYVEVVVEEVTLDKWYAPLSEPVRPKRKAEEGYAWAPQPIAGDVRLGYEPLSEPVRPKPKQYESFFWSYTLVVVQSGNDDVRAAQFDSEILSRRSVLYPTHFEPIRFVSDEVVTVDKWFRPLSEPVRREVVRQEGAIPWAPLVQAAPGNNDTELDEYYRPFSEPVRRKPNYHRLESFFWSYTLVVLTGNNDTELDEYYRPLSEPTRRLFRPQPDSFTWVPPELFQFSQFSVNVTQSFQKALIYPSIQEPVNFAPVVIIDQNIISTEVIHLPVDVVLHGEQIPYKTSNYSQIPPSKVSESIKVTKGKVRRLKGKTPSFTTKTDKRGYD